MTVAAISLVVYLFGLGWTPLANPDEARYAEIAREMLASGDFVTPRLDDVVYFEKPPLTCWTVAASIALFGPGELAARLPSALFGVLGVSCTYVLGRSIGGPAAGRWSALILGSSLLYFALARVLLTDMAVASLITATLACFLLGVRAPPGRRRRLLFYGLYCSAAGATLAKGLIGFLLPGAIMFLWLAIYRQWRRLRPIYLPSGLLLFLVIAAPWHILVALRNPQWANFYFIHEHFARFVTAVHDRAEPWWFFLPVMLVGLFPWTGLLWPALRGALRNPDRARDERADLGLLVVWGGFILLFFSLSHSKLVPYILPALPPFAVLGGVALTGGRAVAVRGFTVRAFSLAAGLLGAALLVGTTQPRLVARLEHGSAVRQFAILAGMILVAGSAAAWLMLRNGRGAEALRIMLLTSAGFFATLVLVSPGIARSSTRDLARVFLQEAGPKARVLHYKEFFHDFTYYAGRPVDVVDGIGELEVRLDPVAARSGRFIDDGEFARLWRSPGKLYVVARADAASAWLDQAGAGGRVLARSYNHVLFTNRATP